MGLLKFFFTKVEEPCYNSEKIGLLTDKSARQVLCAKLDLEDPISFREKLENFLFMVNQNCDDKYGYDITLQSPRVGAEKDYSSFNISKLVFTTGALLLKREVQLIVEIDEEKCRYTRKIYMNEFMERHDNNDIIYRDHSREDKPAYIKKRTLFLTYDLQKNILEANNEKEILEKYKNVSYG